MGVVVGGCLGGEEKWVVNLGYFNLPYCLVLKVVNKLCFLLRLWGF